jgi:hypothetical protein
MLFCFHPRLVFHFLLHFLFHFSFIISSAARSSFTLPSFLPLQILYFSFCFSSFPLPSLSFRPPSSSHHLHIFFITFLLSFIITFPFGSSLYSLLHHLPFIILSISYPSTFSEIFWLAQMWVYDPKYVHSPTAIVTKTELILQWNQTQKVSPAEPYKTSCAVLAIANTRKSTSFALQSRAVHKKRGSACRLLLQSSRLAFSAVLEMERCVPPLRRDPTKLHGVIIEKLVLCSHGHDKLNYESIESSSGTTASSSILS